MDVYDHQTASEIEYLRDTADEMEEAYARTLDFDDNPSDVQEGLDEAGALAVGLLGDVIRIIDGLRNQGADVDETPTEPEAILVLLANMPKLVTHFEKMSKEAIATLEMVEKRIRARVT